MSVINKAYLKALSYYLPDKVVTNEELLKEFPEWSVDKVAAKVGVQSRHIAASEETAGDLAEKAARKLFEENNVDPKSIDFLLLCTQSPDYFLPSTSCILQNKLGLRTDIGAFDYNLGCSGCICFAEIGEFVLGTDGSGAENLIVKTGAARHKEQTGKFVIDDEGHTWYDDYLYMNGGAIFNFTLEAVPTMVKQLLERSGIQKEDVDYYIFHQANKFMLNTIRKVCALPKDKFYINLEHTGNTVSSTVLIGLKDCLKNGTVAAGMKVMITGFGVGLSWAGVMLKFP